MELVTSLSTRHISLKGMLVAGWIVTQHSVSIIRVKCDMSHRPLGNLSQSSRETREIGNEWWVGQSLMKRDPMAMSGFAIVGIAMKHLFFATVVIVTKVALQQEKR
eukprot:13060338-Ditylum_brightwellii.AAC.1